MRIALRRFAAPFLLLFALLAAAPAVAQSDPVPAVSPEPWQQVITSQIEAFRHQDATAAFSFAGAFFQQAYPSAEAFFAVIVGSGYAPIMESTSHSFGEFVLGDDEAGVAQLVKLVGKSQELYEAIYSLREEEGGWRVQGVSLKPVQGVGI